jgi:hypothetical protein
MENKKEEKEEDSSGGEAAEFRISPAAAPGFCQQSCTTTTKIHA